MWKPILIGIITALFIASSFGGSLDEKDANPILTKKEIIDFMVMMGADKGMISNKDISDIYQNDISDDFLEWTGMTKDEGASFIKSMFHQVIISGPEALEEYISYLPIDDSRPKPELTFDQEELNAKRNEPITLAVYGSIPEFETQEEKEEWLNELRKVKDDAKDSIIEEYFYPRGPLTAYGIGKGYQMVGLQEWSGKDESLLEDIYLIIEGVAKKNGIVEIPVVFLELGLPIKDSTRYDRYRPVWGGVEVWNQDSYGYFHQSTIGYPATRYGVKGYTVSGHLTFDGFHILRTEITDVFHQPNMNHPATGYVTDVPSLTDAYADVAFVQFSNVIGIIFTDDNTVLHMGLTVGYYDPSLYEDVYMSGISAGWVNGEIQYVYTDISDIVYETLQDQFLADYPSYSGDSGAPVLTIFRQILPGFAYVDIHGVHNGHFVNDPQYDNYAVFSPQSGVYTEVVAIPLKY